MRFFIIKLTHGYLVTTSTNEVQDITKHGRWAFSTMLEVCEFLVEQEEEFDGRQKTKAN